MIFWKKRGIRCCICLSLLLSAAGAAWACSPQARFTLDPKAAPAGSQVRLEGSSFTPNTPVTFLWGTQRGPALGVFNSDAKGEISAAVTIPEVAPDVYFIVSSAGPGSEVARSSFTVTAQAAAAGDRGTGQMPETATSATLWAGYAAPAGGWQPGEVRPAAETGGENQRAALSTAGGAMVAISSVALLSVFALASRGTRRRIS